MSDELPPYVQHSDTSLEAAVAIKEKAQQLREAVYRYLASCGDRGATDDEIQAALAMPGNTERPRRRELEQAGRIRDSGVRRLNQNRRNVIVWTVRPKESVDPQGQIE